MRVEAAGDAESFLAEAGAFLVADEARHNLLLGIAGTIGDSAAVYPKRRFWVVRDGDTVVGAALRTPPYSLVLARPRDDAVLAVLAEGIDDELPGVVGSVPEVHSFAELWSSRHDLELHVERNEGVYSLERVSDVPGVPGTMRTATAADNEVLVRWVRDFSFEVLGEHDPGRENPQRIVDQRLSSPAGGFVLWEDGGEPVSVSGFGGPTPNGIRVGPVYTPPELRGRGYATALVAELSLMLLARGKRFCFLFTDLANPTSNAIYERIGYVRVCEAAHVSFRR